MKRNLYIPFALRCLVFSLLFCVICFFAEAQKADRGSSSSKSWPSSVSHNNSGKASSLHSSGSKSSMGKSSSRNDASSSSKHSSKADRPIASRGDDVNAHQETYVPAKNNDTQKHYTGNDVKIPEAAVKPETLQAKVFAKATAYTNFFTIYQVTDFRRRQLNQRSHCGCAGDLSFVNNTGDTLDMFFKYLSQRQIPTIDGVTMQRASMYQKIPSFYILPNDTATFRGSCDGGLQYEAVTHDIYRTPTTKRGKYEEFHGVIRMSCMKKVIDLRPGGVEVSERAPGVMMINAKCGY